MKKNEIEWGLFLLAESWFKKHHKRKKLIFVSLEVAYVKFIEKHSHRYVESIFVDTCRFLVVIREGVDGLEHYKDALLKRNVKTWIMKMRDAQSPRRVHLFY